MTLRPEPLRTRPGAALPGLSPLLLAILAAFPGAGGAAALARPAAPAPATVPVPARVGWLVSTSAPYSPTPTPVPVANGSGGTNLTINQASTSAVYNWQSFDIGAASSVTFNYPSASSSSLNRVTGSTAPSAIYGSLKSQYPNPDQKVGGSLVGGSIYLINANGILFGKTAQVDTGALIASTLDLQNADFYAGMSNSIASQGYTFGKFDALGDTPASLLPGADNFVLVDAGARITTASGGRVFLFANSEVQNAGSITTPNGQTVLAAGDAVYLNVPTNEPLYASEVNAAIPAVNGLLVEVGTGMGQVANLSGGVINTPTGNTTLVGMAVNQSGRINATTSVAQDGSVFLLARGNATGRLSATGGLNVKEAATGGTLTLGSGGVIAIEPDTTLDAQGQQATSNANSSFTPSLVQLSGKTIDMQSGAAIVAHGGVVDARAETTPYYVTTEDNPTRTYDYAAMTGDDARLVIGKDATIDVSGTTTTAVSAGRNFVTTALLGANDLADAPLQRSGPIYRSELTFDLRSAVPILGSTAAYTNAIEKTATEQLAAGGKIKLASTGAVVTNAASTLNVSGGVVNYSAATVAPSELLGSDGKLYTFNQAPAGLTYTAVLGAPTGLLDRWGVVPSYSPSQVSSGFVTPGYVAGQAGGTLSVVSPLAVLDGQILAGVTQGARQSAGLDPLAAASKLVLGARSNGSLAFGGEGFLSAGLVDLDINAAPGAMGDAFWSNPLDPKATLPATSRIAASTLDASGLGQLTITANGGIALNTGADLDLPTSAVVDLAAGSGGIALDADIHAAGGSVSARTRPMDGQVGIDGQGAAGALTLAAGTTIDVAATWVNRALDGATAMASTAGGAVTLSAGGALDLQDASVIDVSGAATVGTGGKVAATAAGSVTLQAGMAVPDGGAAAPVHIGAELVADSLAGGGALTLNAGSITIGAGAIASGVADGAAVGSLVLSNQFFDQGAFTSYNVNAVTSLTLAAGATLQPQASNWILSADAASMPTGSLPSSFLAVGRLADAERAPVSLQLKAASLKGSVAGDLTLAAGSSIRTDPLAAVTLSAGWNLMDAAKIVAPGGKVTLNLVGSTSQPVAGTLDLAAGAGIEVSGTTLLQPQTGALPTGQVLAGGQVTLAVSNGTNTPIVVAPGVVIAADGTSAQLGVSTTNAQGNVGTSLQTVASAGGSISIANAYGGSLAGDMHALGGDASVSGGSFALSGVDTIVVQQAPVAAVTPKAGVSAVSVSGQALSQDFANVSLQADQQVRFVTDTDLSLAGNLLIDAPALVLAPGVASVALAGASTLLVGASYQAAPGTAGAIGGSGQLTLRGGLVELFGHQVLQGVGDAAVYAASELRLQSSTGAVGLQGGLDLQGDLTLSAPDIAPTSGSQYTINAAGQRVRVTGGDAGAALPLSAGGSLTINAADIAIGDATDATQAGVLRAPFGSITLNASDRLVVGNGSLLSVAGTGLTVPYGQTTGGTSWTYDGVAVAAPPAKLISLSAPDGAVDVAAGAKLDLSGGGNLVAQEFVPGNGGSKNIFAGAANGAFAIVPTAGAYAAQDVDILTKQPDVNGVVPSLQLGRTVTFGSGGPIPAGTYAVMPAQYATLAGAFLVTPTSASAPLALGAAIKQSDGSVLVGGRIGAAGTRFASALTQSFKVQTSAQALAYSEIDQANANAYFNAQAAAQGVAAPALPTDAGVLAIAAGQLSLKGSTLFALPTVTTTTGTTSTTTTVGRGGELDISADDIQVGGSAAAGVLALSPSDLNATGASLVVLGGQKDLSSGKVEVTADSVVIANAGTPLKVNDLVLVAKDAVTLQAGSAIEAPAASTTAAQVAAPTLNLVGDGALLRVATDASAASVRSGAQGLSGSLSIGAATTLSGGAITAEGTLANTIAGDATLTAQAITIGAGHMAAGELGATTPGAHTLVLTSTLARQVAGAQSLTLRSATGIDLYGDVTLGGAAVRSLTLDTGSLVLIGDQSTATIEAGGVTLKNTTGHAGVASTGSGTLQVEALATTAAGGSGQVLVGPGAVAIVGASAVALSAAHEVLLGDQAALGTAGDLAISAASLQGTRAAQAALAVGGRFTLAAAGTASSTAAGAGAQLRIAAGSLEQDGAIVLPSGQLTLQAAGGGDAVHFAAGSQTDLSGNSNVKIDGIVIPTPGGTLNVLSPAGNVTIDTGATIDVSAPATGAHAGSITISAPTGSVALQGSLRGNAATGQASGSLSVDSATAIDLAALAATIAALPNNFGASLALRNRSGDQLLAAGTRLSAQRISLGADSGTLAIAGALDASGASGTQIVLAGGAGLDIDAGAAISAHSTGSTGSQVELLSGDRQLQADGTFTGSSGAVRFNGGTIDLGRAAVDASDGALLVRAQRGADGTGVAIAGSGGTTVAGASQIEIESVKQYAATTVGAALIAQVTADNLVVGADSAALLARVGALIGQPASTAMQLRSGVEIDSSGDLAMVGTSAVGGWNLTSFAANGSAQAQASGAPMDLTLRAAGNLTLTGSLSDGFLPTGVAPTTAAAASKIAPAAVVAQIGGQYAQGANISLVGGADLAAADVMATRASSDAGDVTIGAAGKNVLVRSTTGNIAIAAGRDVTLLNAQADVYTTGTPVSAQALQQQGYVGNLLPAAAYLHNGNNTSLATSQSPFLSGGGSLSVLAGRDITGADPNAATLQKSSAWAWRASDQASNGQPLWWSRYDLFQQGFATFGGGNVWAQAGQDVVNAGFTAAVSGYVPRDATTGSALAARTFGGGDLSVQAGRDVIGSSVLAAGATGSVQAGRAIAASNGQATAPYALQVQYGNTALDIGALDSVELGLVSAFGMTPGSTEYKATTAAPFGYLMGLTSGATLDVLAAAGDLAYDATSPLDLSTGLAVSLVADRIVPDITHFSAPNGSIRAGALIQNPAGTTQLSLLAQDGLTVAGITVNGTDVHAATPTLLNESDPLELDPLNNYIPGLTPYDLGTRSPMELVAQTGDVIITGGIKTATALRLIAGRDIVLGPAPNANSFHGITLQHESAAEISLIEAGRDILFPDDALSGKGDVNFYGPGDLLVLAGRNIDLSTSGGIRALGNRENANPLLPAGSGKVTLATGVALANGDYTQAAAWYFPLLGGTGIAGFAADLAAQLGALKAGQPLPALGSGAARQYAALSVADQVTQVKALAGDVVFNATLLADARRRAGDAGLGLQQAQAAFDKLDAAAQSTVLGAALANAWIAALTPAQQRVQVLAMASSSAYGKPLEQFVLDQGGPAAAATDLGVALAAFEDMAPERQALFTNLVLVDVIRSAGRTASALSGSAQAAAYQPAYAALDTVFPGVGANGNLEMGASQVETLQDSNITILAPRGSVDVGTVVASLHPKPASSLGIVSADGGDVSVVVGGSVNVNQSRVFTVGVGDLLMWASNGSLDAGRGGKTVVGAPTPVYTLDPKTGVFTVDLSGSFSGSGIAVLDAASDLDLYAPKGTIDAGDAGIKSLGNAYFGAAAFVGTDNFAVSGVSVGAPPPASTGGATAGLAAVGQSASTATQLNAGDSDEEKERKRRKRLNLVLDFLGFGDGQTKP